MRYSLKELRARKNWTQKETAERMGISVQTYNAWEKDISRIAVGKVLKLANVFEVDISEIKITDI
ncbi:MAG: helix-turn-helix transcriptional regulator [Mogibacterium sp.]|nr:helix-turn-helix transcriptional regulator [Mogibacterium sp.]